ncbi:MAG: hypothetical protein COA45_08120 [Zetaproteobacteria bacterium]|nr:MAG: hypothetical protein COA45_08120 [Zetaproteobacteria bacterium]
MRKFSFLMVFAALSLSACSSKPWSGDDFKPYLGEQQIRQSSLWEGDNWTPEDWLKEEGDEKRVMHDLYAANIVTDQYTDNDNIPVLEVGEQFMRMSGIDRYRVLQFMDHVFEITTSSPNGMFYVIYNLDDDDPVGLYNKHGFQRY